MCCHQCYHFRSGFNNVVSYPITTISKWIYNISIPISSWPFLFLPGSVFPHRYDPHLLTSLFFLTFCSHQLLYSALSCPLYRHQNGDDRWRRQCIIYRNILSQPIIAMCQQAAPAMCSIYPCLDPGVHAYIDYQ